MHIYHRQNVVVEEINQTLHGVELTAGETVAERLYLEEQHDFHNLVGHTVAGATGMRHHEVYLQLGELVLADRHIAKRTETCGHAIYRFLVHGHFLVEIFTAAQDACTGIVAEFQLITVEDDFADTLYAEMLG